MLASNDESVGIADQDEAFPDGGQLDQAFIERAGCFLCSRVCLGAFRHRLGMSLFRRPIGSIRPVRSWARMSATRSRLVIGVLSLDIDADMLVTDAVPADVMLQRAGRAGRHRPDMISDVLIIDPGAWDRYVAESGWCHGINGQGWGWVYDAAACECAPRWTGCTDAPW